MPAWKVASGEVASRPLLERMLAHGGPILLSTGMSPIDEVDAAVALVRRAGRPFAVMQATTAYPCPPERLGLNMLGVYRERYGCPVGLSDHSATIYAGLAAVTLGCNLLEVHVTLSREMFGPDVAASVTTAEMRQLVDGVRFIERAKTSPVDKDALARELRPLREMFGKSVVSRTALPAGTVLRSDHLTVKKPGTGIPAVELTRVVGRKLARAVAADQLLSWEDLDGAN
jgi:N-acetylneuraminate synthase